MMEDGKPAPGSAAAGDRFPLAGMLFFAAYMLMVATTVLYPEIFLKQSIQMLGVEVTPLVALAPLVLLAFLSYFVPQIRSFQPEAFDAAFLLALAYTAIRLIAGASARVEIKLALEYAVYGIVAYYGAATLFRSRERLRRFIWFLIGLLLLVSLYEVLTFLLGRDPVYGAKILERIPLKSEDFFRGGSTLAQPVYLGAFLLQIAPFAYWGIHSAGSRLASRFALIALIAAGVAGILSFSRGAWAIGFLMAMAVVVIRWRQVKKGPLLAALAVLLTVVGVLALRGDLGFHVLERDESTEMRSWTREWSADVFQEHPVFGVGLFKGAIEINKKKGSQDRDIPIDNYYITVVIEEGLAGVLLYGTVLVFLGLNVYGVMRRGPPYDRLLPLMITMSMLGVMADAVFFDAFIVWPFFILFWMTAGMMRALERAGK